MVTDKDKIVLPKQERPEDKTTTDKRFAQAVELIEKEGNVWIVGASVAHVGMLRNRFRAYLKKHKLQATEASTNWWRFNSNRAWIRFVTADKLLSQTRGMPGPILWDDYAIEVRFCSWLARFGLEADADALKYIRPRSL